MTHYRSVIAHSRDISFSAGRDALTYCIGRRGARASVDQLPLAMPHDDDFIIVLHPAHGSFAAQARWSRASRTTSHYFHFVDSAHTVFDDELQAAGHR